LYGAGNSASQPPTKIRAVHIEELRACINWAQSLAGVSKTTWTNEPISTTPPYTKIQAIHINEMQSALGALCAHNGSTIAFASAGAKSSFSASTIVKLRNAIATCAAPPQPSCLADGTQCGSQSCVPTGWDTQCPQGSIPGSGGSSGGGTACNSCIEGDISQCASCCNGYHGGVASCSCGGSMCETCNPTGNQSFAAYCGPQ
jgi:hypothetical protein